MWYPAKPDAPVLDVESVICSLDWWCRERELGVYQGYHVGEVPERPRVYNGQKVKPNANGLHRCGTEEEWRDGAVFDPTLNRPRRADGLPTCCGEMPVGMVMGGRAITQRPVGGPIVGGRSRVLAPGITYGGGDFFVNGTDFPAAGWAGNAGFSGEYLMSHFYTVGATYKFQLWAPTDLSSVRIGGNGLFGGGVWFNDFADPSAGYFEWTQTIPSSTIRDSYWLVTKPDTNPRNYVTMVSRV